MHRRIGIVPGNASRLVRLWLVAIAAAAIAYGIKRVLPFHRPLLVGPAVLIPYAALYLAITQWMGIASMGSLNRLLRRGR
jgi:putative peptidoglycan lipid II flippase